MFESGKTITGSELCKTGLEVFHKPDLEPRNTTWIRKFALHNDIISSLHPGLGKPQKKLFYWPGH